MPHLDHLVIVDVLQCIIQGHDTGLIKANLQGTKLSSRICVLMR
jgi:hypothetical protein